MATSSNTPHIIHRLHKNRTIDLGIPDESGSTSVEYVKHFTPHNIDRAAMSTLFRGVSDSLKTIAKDMLAQDWKIYVVDQSRGRCYYSAKTITISTWATRRYDGYKTWYIAHEFAHAYTASDGHGDRFMDRLIQTCPPEFLHHEVGYKPQAATRNGISADPAENLRKAEINGILRDPYNQLGF